MLDMHRNEPKCTKLNIIYKKHAKYTKEKPKIYEDLSKYNKTCKYTKMSFCAKLHGTFNVLECVKYTEMNKSALKLCQMYPKHNKRSKL